MFALVLCALISACRPQRCAWPAGGHATVTFARPRAPLGSPIEVTYKFQVAANAPAFDQDYRVFVHFLDGDDEQVVDRRPRSVRPDDANGSPAK